MTNSNLQITCEELFALKDEHPLEIQIIMEMLAEAGEDYSAEMALLEEPLSAAA